MTSPRRVCVGGSGVNRLLENCKVFDILVPRAAWSSKPPGAGHEGQLLLSLGRRPRGLKGTGGSGDENGYVILQEPRKIPKLNFGQQILQESRR